MEFGFNRPHLASAAMRPGNVHVTADAVADEA